MKTAIRERPILFSGDSIRAILDGKKTVTRRVVKGAPTNRESYVLGIHKGTWGIHADVEKDECVWRGECPYGEPGDRLWVRETWSTTWDKDAFGCIAYKSDGEVRHYICDYNGEGDPLGLGWPAGLVDPVRTWRPSIHMPRWASRITLEVKSVRVERLQEITEAEAIAEGFERHFRPDGTDYGCGLVHAVEEFAALWDQLNAGRGYSWESNPWVWRVEFERIINQG